MNTTKQPFRLLTVLRIAELTRRPVSQIEGLLGEHPGIQPTAIADYRPVYDRESFLRLLSIIDQCDAAEKDVHPSPTDGGLSR